MARAAAALALCLLTASCGGASVVGQSDDAILLRVAAEGDVPDSRGQAADHCAESYRQPVLVSTERLGDSVLAQWECR